MAEASVTSLFETESIKCSSCEDGCLETEVFRCSCLVDNSDIVEFLCDVCIGPHIKKQHDIVDYKGYKPATCSKHRMLSFMFCYDCDMIFCLKCLGPHCKHDYRPVSEKAKEVRKTVFEYLNQFDELAKPMARRRNNVQKFEESHEANFANLGSDGLIGELCKKFETMLRANATKWTEDIETKLLEKEKLDPVFDKLKQADSQIENLRGLLVMSDNTIVSSFFEEKVNFDCALENQKSEVNKHGMVKWCRSLDCLLEACLERTLEKWEISVFERQPIESIHCIREDNLNALGSLVVDYRDVLCPVISEQDVYFMEFRADFPKITKHSFPICGVKSIFIHYNLLAFLFPGNMFDVFNIRIKNSVGNGSLKSSLEVVAFGGAALNDTFFFYVWNPETCSIQNLRGESDVVWEIHCKSKPLLLKKWNDFVAFVESDEKLSVTGISNNLSVEILSMHHGLSQIDLLYLDTPQSRASNSRQCRVILYDYRMKIVLISRCSLESRIELNWRVEKVFRLYGATDVSYISMNRSESHFIVIDSEGDALTAPTNKHVN